ncbi:hypothetical protein [Spiroplasma endosymbiont of Dactylopius coccus]
MIQQHKNPQHFKLLNSYQISRTSVYQKIVLKSVAIPIKQILKHMIGDRTYNIDIYTKMVNFKCYQINTAIQLL